MFKMRNLLKKIGFRLSRRDVVVKAYKTIENQKKMADTLNKSAVIFVSQNEEGFEAKMTAGLKLICDITDINRLSIWRNFAGPDGLCVSQAYRWVRESGGTTEPVPELQDILYSKVVPRWEKLLPKGEIINGPSRLMPEAEILQSFGVVSVLVVPLFIKNDFWGFVLFDDNCRERYFEDDYVNLMRSAAFLCTNIFIRTEMERKIAEQNQLLTLWLEQQKLVSEISKSFISCGDPHKLIHEALGKLGNNLGASRMFIFRMDYEHSGTDAVYQWYADESLPKLRNNRELNLFDLVKGTFPENLSKENVAISPNGHLIASLYAEGRLWGIVAAEHSLGEHEWSEDEKAFFATTSSIIAGAIIRNIYDIKLQETLDKMTNLSKAKDEFLSKISHEIRTPMNAILGITEIQLQNEALPQGTKEGLSIIYSSGDSLLRIINDLLDLSKIEAKKLEITPVRCEMASLISDTVQLNMMRIESKPIEFKLGIDENIPVEFFGDELRIKQVLNNILSNAFKYTSKGEVSMLVSAEKSNTVDCDVVLVFRVSDTGQGMTEEQVRKIFDEYSRFNLTGNRLIEGTGLGMTITRGLVELMDGTISVESKPGKGSVFTIRLPQKTAGAEVLSREIRESLQKFRISSSSQIKKMKIIREPMPYGKVLVVDDVESNLYVAERLMAPYDLLLETATSGFEAIEKIRQGKVYDIIFMDHMMPKMDGIEAVRTLRGLGYANPIVALTANAVAGQAEIFLNNGFDGFISKPVDIYQLNTELNRFIRDRHDIKETEGKFIPEADVALRSIFAQDAKKALPVFESALKNISGISAEDLHLFTVKAHAMKSALANIGEAVLSQAAFELEQAGKKNDRNTITQKTQKLIDALDSIIKESANIEESTDENSAYLSEQLKIIGDACVNYDGQTADVAIKKLKKMSWTRKTRTLIDQISEYLLHSDFEEAGALATDS